ncbi:Strongly-conserved Zn-finger binding protein (TFIIIA) [Tyrophagus putrescentiae]|nr:Strongly-conserved Zn-finger binding protein (TFIIIA) [Tyrophagus putrescentiae]
MSAQHGEVRRSSRVRRTTSVSLLLPEPSAYTAKKRKAKVGRKGLPAKRAAVQKQLNFIREDSPAPKAVMGNGGKVIKVEEEEEEEDDQPTVRQLSGTTRPLPQPHRSLNGQSGSKNGGGADPRSKGIIAKRVRHEGADAEYNDDEETDEEDLKVNVQNFLQLNYSKVTSSTTKTTKTITTTTTTTTTTSTTTTTPAKPSTTASSSSGSSSSDPQSTAASTAATPKSVSKLPQPKPKPKQAKPKPKPKGPEVHRCEQCGLVFQTAAILARHQLANRDRPDHASSSSSLLITDARRPQGLLSTPTQLNGEYGTLNRDVPPLEAFTGYLNGPRMERVYRCDRCPSVFPSPATLSVHRTASLHIAPTKKLREFLCVECSKVFSRQDYLLYHLKHVHQASEEELRGRPMQLPRRHTQVFGNENGIFVPLPIINSFSSNSPQAPPMGVLPPLPPLRPPAILPPPILSRSILPAQPVLSRKALLPPILPPSTSQSPPVISSPVLLPQVFPPSVPLPVQSLPVQLSPPPVVVGAVVQQQSSSSLPPQQPPPSQQPPPATSSSSSSRTFELKTNLKGPPVPIFSTEKVNAGTKAGGTSSSLASSAHHHHHHQTVPPPPISDIKKAVVVRAGRLAYPCPKCPLVLQAPSKLKQHMRSVHIGLREHRCPVCARPFGKKENLKRHFLLRHPSAKPYFSAHQCRYCPQAFPTRPALEEHRVAVHRLNNTLKCDQCEATFSRNVRLQDHRGRHHSGGGAPEEAAVAAAVRPFPCPFCECTYKQVVQLRMHLKMHSLEEEGGDEETRADGPVEVEAGEEEAKGSGQRERAKDEQITGEEPVENSGNNAAVLNAGDKEEGEEGKEKEEEEKDRSF